MAHHASGAEGLTSREVARRKMIAFYSRHLPEKLPTVDSILDQYRGNEDVVIRAMQVKYPTWNFDYLPPDLAPVLGPMPVSPHVAPVPLSPTQYAALPPAALASTQSPAMQPAVQPAVATREELHGVVQSLQEKMLIQQRSEMSALESKITQLVDIAQEAQRRRDRDETRRVVRIEEHQQDPMRDDRRKALDMMQSLQEQVQAQRTQETEKDRTLQSLHQQVEKLSTALSKREQEATAQQEAASVQQQLLAAKQELDELRIREAHRMRQEITEQSEMERVRRENEALREEGEEGRELIIELHSVVEQLRHANQSKSSEIETLLSSAQTLKGYYQSSQTMLETQQAELDRERSKTKQALVIAAQATLPTEAPPMAPYSPMYSSTSPATLAAHGPQPVIMHAPVAHAHVPHAPMAPMPMPQVVGAPLLQAQPPPPPTPVPAAHPVPAPVPRPRAGISPPRPGQTNSTFDLMASLQRRAYENMVGR